MKKDLPVPLFNGTIVTTNGLYRIEDISTEKARQIVQERGFISAVGHEATAEVFSEMLEENVTYQRIQFQQEVGQQAIALKLNQRPPEGNVLSKSEVAAIGFSLKLITRIE